MTENKYFVIKDNRDNKVYIDDSGFVRNFETILESNLTKNQSVEKYPHAVIVDSNIFDGIVELVNEKPTNCKKTKMINITIQIIEAEIELANAGLKTLKKELELLVDSKESSPEVKAERVILECNIIGEESKIEGLHKHIEGV